MSTQPIMPPTNIIKDPQFKATYVSDRLIKLDNGSIYMVDNPGIVGSVVTVIIPSGRLAFPVAQIVKDYFSDPNRDKRDNIGNKVTYFGGVTCYTQRNLDRMAEVVYGGRTGSVNSLGVGETFCGTVQAMDGIRTDFTWQNQGACTVPTIQEFSELIYIGEYVPIPDIPIIPAPTPVPIYQPITWCTPIESFDSFNTVFTWQDRNLFLIPIIQDYSERFWFNNGFLNPTTDYVMNYSPVPATATFNFAPGPGDTLYMDCAVPTTITSMNTWTTTNNQKSFRKLISGTDYTINYATGHVIFTSFIPVVTDEIYMDCTRPAVQPAGWEELGVNFS